MQVFSCYLTQNLLLPITENRKIVTINLLNNLPTFLLQAIFK